MASVVAKKVGLKMAAPALQNALGGQNLEDPYFEQIPVKDKNGNVVVDREGKAKMKKRRRGLPPGISDNDGQILTAVKRSAYRLDLSLFTCCGIRFGWSSVIGLIPVIGDTFEVLLAYRVMRNAEKIDGGLPVNLKLQMIINIMIDFAVGFVPLLGDLVDAIYKCNTKNAAILEKYLRAQGAKNFKESGQPAPPANIDAPVNFELEESEHRQEHSHHAHTDGSTNESGQSPTAGSKSSAVEGTGWFRWISGRSKQKDPESNIPRSAREASAVHENPL